MKKLISGLLVGVAMAATAQAKIVTYNFTGEISALSITGSNADGAYTSVPLDGVTLTLGQTFHGQFSYDTAVTLTPIHPKHSSAPSLNSSASIAVDQVDHTFLSTQNTGFYTPTIDVYGDGLSMRHYKLKGQSVYSMEIAFYGNNQPQEGVVPDALRLADFARANVFYSYWDFSSSIQTSSISKITSLDRVAEVPEPASYALLLVGLLTMGAAWRCRKPTARV